MSDDIHEIPIEIRGVDDVEEATLENVWVAGQPVGSVIKGLGRRVTELEDTVDEHEGELSDAKILAQSAKGVAEARSRADGAGETNQTEIAANKSRNEVVRRVADGQGRQVSVADVKEMCKPELDVHWQTVKRSWDTLVARWSCFSIKENEGGVKVLTVEPSRISDELAFAVQEDLAREGLAKRFVGGRGKKGA